jgi:hypothetical protein
MLEYQRMWLNKLKSMGLHHLHILALCTGIGYLWFIQCLVKLPCLINVEAFFGDVKHLTKKVRNDMNIFVACESQSLFQVQNKTHYCRRTCIKRADILPRFWLFNTDPHRLWQLEMHEIYMKSSQFSFVSSRLRRRIV